MGRSCISGISYKDNTIISQAQTSTLTVSLPFIFAFLQAQPHWRFRPQYIKSASSNLSSCDPEPLPHLRQHGQGHAFGIRICGGACCQLIMDGQINTRSKDKRRNAKCRLDNDVSLAFTFLFIFSTKNLQLQMHPSLTTPPLVEMKLLRFQSSRMLHCVDPPKLISVRLLLMDMNF